MLPGVGRQIQCLLCLDGLLFSSLDDSREIPTHIPSCHFLHPPNDCCPPSVCPSHPFSHAPPERVTARPGYRRRFDGSQGLRMLQHITKSSWPGLPRPSSPTFPPPTSVPRPHLHRDWPATPHGLRKNSSTGAGSQATRQHLPAPRRLGGCFSAARRALGGSRGLILRSLSGSRRPFGRYRATTQKEPRQFGAVSTVAQTTAAMIRRLFLGARCPLAGGRQPNQHLLRTLLRTLSSAMQPTRNPHGHTMGKSSLTQTDRLRASSFARPVPKTPSSGAGTGQASKEVLASWTTTVTLRQRITRPCISNGGLAPGEQEGRYCGEVDMISRLSTTPMPLNPIHDHWEWPGGSRCVCVCVCMVHVRRSKRLQTDQDAAPKENKPRHLGRFLCRAARHVKVVVRKSSRCSPETRQGGGVSLHRDNPPPPALSPVSPQSWPASHHPQAGEQVPGGGEGGDGRDLGKESGDKTHPHRGTILLSDPETASRPDAHWRDQPGS